MKYVIVTGSSGGVGSATIDKLINEKDIFIFGLDLNNNREESDNYKFIKCDIRNIEDIKEAKNIILKYTSELDTIFNLAGVFYFESLVEGDSENLYKIFDINFYGTYRINKEFLNLLKKGSRIIIFSSEVALYSPQPFNGYYALPKITLDKYADCLRRELNYLGIKVIKVESGAIKTNMLDSVNSKYQKLVSESVYYKKPLTTLKSLMDDEIKKQTPASKVGDKLIKIYNKKNPKISYRYKNSFKLRFLSILPEKIQDIIYLKVIK